MPPKATKKRKAQVPMGASAQRSRRGGSHEALNEVTWLVGKAQAVMASGRSRKFMIRIKYNPRAYAGTLVSKSNEAKWATSLDEKFPSVRELYDTKEEAERAFARFCTALKGKLQRNAEERRKIVRGKPLCPDDAEKRAHYPRRR